MARRLRFLFPVILGFWLAASAPAQTPRPKKAPEQTGSATHVNIGESVIAQAFGQEDDISVISVTRTAVMQAVPA